MKSEKRPIEIEDLLRLKRAERPPVEFWAHFDRELRAKQLAALVAKRPWWQSLPRSFPRFSRYHLPLGAACALAATLVVMRQSHGVSPVKSENTMAAVRAVTTTTAPVPAHAAPESSRRESIAPSPVSVDVSAVAVNVSAISAAATSNDGPASNEPAQISSRKSSAEEFALSESGSELRLVGETLAAAPAVGSSLSRGLLINASTSFEARALPARATVEPLQQIMPPGERTRAKLLTAMVSMTAFESPARTGERAADRISEERLYDQLHRFSAKGAGMSMKF